MYEVIQTMDKD